MKHTKHSKIAKAQRLASAWGDVPENVFARLGVTTATLHELDQLLLGHIILPGMADYAAARMGKGMSPFDEGDPLIVFHCRDVQDVWLAMKACHDHDWPFMARSGGHSTAGFSSTSQTIIDLSGMDDISLMCDNRVSVGPGCSFGKFNRFMKLHRLHVPTGNCDDVCCGGYVQGGGYGYTSRQHGMQLDSVVEATLLLADGRSVTASKDENSDLFWAMRGGTGGQFGIVVNIVYQAIEWGEMWGFVINWFEDDAPRALKVAQDTYGPDSGLEIGYTGNITTIAVGTEGERVPVYQFSGICMQGREIGMKALQPMLDIGGESWGYDQTGYYFDINDGVEGNLPGPPTDVEGMCEIKSSGYLEKPMSLEDWTQFFRFYVNNIARTNPYNLIVLEAYGGAINRVPVSETAFIHRNVLMDIYIDAFWAPDERLGSYDQAQKWMDGLNEFLAPRLNGHYYQNYPQRDMPNFRWQYWGDAFNSLLFVKRKFDPDHVFQYEQSITPYPSDPDIRKSSAPSRWSDPDITYNGQTPSFVSQGTGGAGDTV